MRKLLPFVSLIIIVSCGEKGSSEKSEPGNILENLTYSVDTVVVDVGDEIFMAAGYYAHELSADGKSVFYAMGQSPEVHQIDLEKLTLSKRFYFEKDGPNRAPDFIDYFEVVAKDEFLLANYGVQGIYNQQGEITQRLDIQPDQFAGIDNSIQWFYKDLKISPDKNKAISLPNVKEGTFAGLAILDLKEKTGKILQLPALEITNQFQSAFSKDGGTTTFGDFVALQKINNQCLLYSGSTSDIYLYDWATDSVYLKTFDHQLVPNKKTGDYPSQASSIERLREIGKEINSQVSFNKFMWDDTRNLYFRYASKVAKYRDDGLPNKIDIYLFSYDENFQLIGEKEVDSNSMIFRDPFFYQGQLYSYFPVEENPGFIRHTLNF